MMESSVLALFVDGWCLLRPTRRGGRVTRRHGAAWAARRRGGWGVARRRGHGRDGVRVRCRRRWRRWRAAGRVWRAVLPIQRVRRTV